MTNVYLDHADIDDMGRMVASLLSELWITRDRVAVLEELLAQTGVISSEAVETFDWPPEKVPEIEAIRDRMVASVLGAPLGSRERHVDQMLTRGGFSDHSKRREAAASS